jgi:hypothetical protein
MSEPAQIVLWRLCINYASRWFRVSVQTFDAFNWLGMAA